MKYFYKECSYAPFTSQTPKVQTDPANGHRRILATFFSYTLFFLVGFETLHGSNNLFPVGGNLSTFEYIMKVLRIGLSRWKVQVCYLKDD